VRYGPGTVQIATLAGHDHLAPVLGAWHHAEWGHLYPDDVWNATTAVAEFQAMARPDARDRTLVAFEGGSRNADAVLGSVSLVASDDLEGFEHLAPWLASMFVVPRARGRGIAVALTEALMLEARAAGHDTVHLFTSGQQQFWADRGWCVVAEVTAHGHAAAVMARRTHERATRRTVCSTWCSDPDHGGAYSHLRLHGTPDHRRRLAQAILPGLWFAGEATSVDHPATMHGAWWSGERAARQVLDDATATRVAVIGAGLAGLAAAHHLAGARRQVTVFESKTHAGGRVATDHSTGALLPLGAAWLHGDHGHPLRERVTAVPDEFDDSAFFGVGVGRLAPPVVDAVTALYRQFHRACDQADAGVGAAEVLDAVLAATAPAPLVADALRAWIVGETEGLFGAPLGDLPAKGGYEPFELPGGDHLVVSDLGALAERLAEGLDLRRGHRVHHLDYREGVWIVDGEHRADAVIVTVPITALANGRIAFTPALPPDVETAIASLGSGPITKLFATFDTAWWPSDRLIHLVGTEELRTLIDVTTAAGRPTLVGFALGDAAGAVEQLSEFERCRLFDRTLDAVGLTTWDADGTDVREPTR